MERFPVRVACRLAGVLLGGVLWLGVAPGVDAATNQFSVVNSGFTAFMINGVGNPTLQLVRGFTYTFELNASGHPFWIKTVQGIGGGDAYTNGVTGNGTQTGTLTFVVPGGAPDTLYYNCQFHAAMTGQILVEDPPVIEIRQISPQAEQLLLRSIGTDALNVRVYSRDDLLSGSWQPVVVVSNTFTVGTNTTAINLLPDARRYYQVAQGLP